MSKAASPGIGYCDPARGGAAGVHAGRVIEQLGLTAQLKDRTTLTEHRSFTRLG